MHQTIDSPPKRFRLALLCMCALYSIALADPPQTGDIYGYTDGDGTLHLSNVPHDPRYSIYLARRDLQTTAGHPLDPEMIAQAARFDPIINRTAKELRLQGDLLRAVIAVESGFDPDAESPRGAKGLMQLMPLISTHYGVEDPWDPRDNIRAGAMFLRDLMDRYDSNLELVLAAYNAGEPAVEAHGRVIPPFSETKAYVPQVLSIYKGLTSLSVKSDPA